jgi:hypothetical protein
VPGAQKVNANQVFRMSISSMKGVNVVTEL